MWSDDSEVTAEDYVASFRYEADPKHAWDFSWFYSGFTKNWTKVVAGELPTSEAGVKVGADKYKVVFETEQPVPFLPLMLIYSWPLQAKALAAHGSGTYNLDPATCVSSGPWLLEEFSPDKRVALKPNTKYTGKLKPMTDSMHANVVSGGQRPGPLHGRRGRLHQRGGGRHGSDPRGRGPQGTARHQPGRLPNVL